MKLAVATICKRLKALEVAEGRFLTEAQQWALEGYRDLREIHIAQVTSTSRGLEFAGETEASRSSILQGAVPARREKTGVLTNMDDKINSLLVEVDTMTDVDALRAYLKQQLNENRATRAWMRVWRKNSKNITGEIDSHLAGESLKAQE